MKKNLIVLGGGRFSHLIEGLATDVGKYEKIIFYDDIIKSERISGTINDAEKEDPSCTEFVIGVGYLHFSLREELYNRFSEKYTFATLIHPFSFISPKSRIGSGTTIFSNTNIEQGVHIGCNTTIFNNTSITHDVQIGSHSFISVGVNMGGGVIIGKKVFIGVGTVIINDIKIEDEATICAGTVISKPVLAKQTVVGYPQRQIDDVLLKRELLGGTVESED